MKTEIHYFGKNKEWVVKLYGFAKGIYHEEHKKDLDKFNISKYSYHCSHIDNKIFCISCGQEPPTEAIFLYKLLNSTSYKVT